MSESVSFTVYGKPRGKGRPRFVRSTGRTYTPESTVSAEDAIRNAWREAGAVCFGDQPVRVGVLVAHERPATHWRKSGGLSAAGEREPYPCRKPDIDNVLKLVGDALNAHAWRDDAQIVEGFVRRIWVGREAFAFIRVAIIEAACRERRS